MLRRRRLLIMSRGPRGFVDTFDTLSPRWQALVGTIGVNAGSLRAVTAGDWLNSAQTNGEFTTVTTGWASDHGGTLTRVDSLVAPGVLSPGVDKWCLEASRVTGDTYSGAVQFWVTIAGATYRGAVWAYAPSANVGVKIALFSLAGAADVVVTAEDAWQLLAQTVVATGVTIGVRLRIYPSEVGDVGYFDGVVGYRQNTPCRLLDWDSPNGIFTLDMTLPATAVTPFSWFTRYTDTLNYWEVRVTPNTAGNDLEIIQVTAGVETQRAAVDVDWTASTAEQLEVTARGPTISTRYKKTAADWVAGPSYATATQGQFSGIHGVMFWGTGVNRLDNLRVQP